MVYSAWRVFCSCFLQGAWSCLNQDMDFKARHVSICAERGCVKLEAQRRNMSMIKSLICLVDVDFLGDVIFVTSEDGEMMTLRYILQNSLLVLARERKGSKGLLALN